MLPAKTIFYVCVFREQITSLKADLLNSQAEMETVKKQHDRLIEKVKADQVSSFLK